LVKILPVARDSQLAPTVDDIINKTSSLFRTWAANREKPHFEERKGK
jgi:hypothetical protein